jgi:predicted NUDIX family NTP pyrophosphohydrolase
VACHAAEPERTATKIASSGEDTHARPRGPLLHAHHVACHDWPVGSLERADKLRHVPKRSAGLLLYRITDGVVEVLIGHPGGPFWVRKDDGAWSIPKGEYTDDEDPWEAAQREFREEVGLRSPDGARIEMAPLRQPGGKVVTAFAVLGDLDVADSVSNTFELEWPKGSGKVRHYPEIDRVGWFSVAQARSKLLKGQIPLLDSLMSDAAVGDSVEGDL